MDQNIHMAKHWSEYKKYQTSFSFAGAGFAGKDGEVVATCGVCGVIAEGTEINKDMTDAIIAHMDEIHPPKGE